MQKTSGETPAGWTDVTDLCRQLAASLGDTSPVAHIEGFSMFDAMGAIELMDEKMDTCHGVSGPMQVEDILATAVPSILTPAAVLMCMQRLAMCEMSYFNGSSMIETFKMCVFMWPQMWPKLEGLGDMGKVLLSYVKSIAKSTSLYHTFILGADVYEEEDFHPGSRAVEADVDDAATALRAAAELLTALTPAAAEQDKDTFSKMVFLLQLREKILDFYASIDDTVVQALEISQRKRPPADEPSALAEAKRTKIAGLCAACRTVYASARALATELIAARTSFDFSGVTMSVTSPTLLEDTDGTFQPKLMKLVTNNPARAVPVPSLTDAFRTLEDVCQQCIIITQIIPGFSAVGATFDSVLAWCASISKSKYHLAARSLQWGLLHTLCSLGGIEDLIMGSLKASWLPEEYTSTPLCAEWIASFAKIPWDSLKIMCMYRYKCLVKLDSNVMSWNKVSEDAPKVDQTIASMFPEKAAPAEIYWATKWCLRIMAVLLEAHVMLLAELELLSGFELDSYYWFLEYITNTRIWAIRKLREMRWLYDKHNHEVKVSEANQLVKAEKKNKKSTLSGKQLKELKRVIESPAPVVFPAPAEETLALACAQAYKGVVRLVTVLLRMGFIRAAPESEFSTREVRFNNRYSLYRSLSHISPVSLADFERSIYNVDELEPSLQEKLASASMALMNAKSGFDSLRKTDLASVQPLAVDLSIPAEYSVFTYTVEHDINEKCLSLMKGDIMVNIFVMRLQQTLKAGSGSVQLGVGEEEKNYRRLASIGFSRDCLPVLALK